MRLGSQTISHANREIHIWNRRPICAPGAGAIDRDPGGGEPRHSRSPVWNKSNREHTIIGSQPDDVRAEADAAVAALGWSGAYYVDADHVG